MTRQAHRVERPTFLEVAVALIGLTVAAIIVIAAGWVILTFWLSAIQYIEAALP